MIAPHPRVLILTTARDISGPVKGIFQFLNSLDGEIHYFLYNIRTGEDCCTLLEEGAARNGIELGSFDQHSRFSPAVLKEIKEFVRANDINIVQTHGYKPTIAGLYLKFWARIPWVCFFHGLTTDNIKVRIYHWLDRLAQLFADKIIIVSEDMRRQIIPWPDKGRIVVIRNAVQPTGGEKMSILADDARRNLGIAPENPLLAVIGRLSPEKGVDIFLNAFSLLRNKTKVHAVIVGDGQERAALEEQSRRLLCEKQVVFTGYTTSVEKYLQAADLVVLPSRSEGIPNVLLEAMSYGKPVIATTVGGVPEVVTHGQEGLLVPPKSPEILAEAIDALLDKPKAMAMYGKAGKQRVLDQFSPEKRKMQILSVYAEVLQQQ